MSLTTIKSTLGFLGGWLRGRLGINRSNATLEGITNYYMVDGLFPTSGQPDENELDKICQSGYSCVINLAPNSMLENSVIDEASILESNNVEYIHLPVNFQRPSEKKFDAFVEAVQKRSGEKVWVHCAANMRVSAFTYRYRVQVLGENSDTARQDLNQLWEPFGVWKTFIEKANQIPE